MSLTYQGVHTTTLPNKRGRNNVGERARDQKVDAGTKSGEPALGTVASVWSILRDEMRLGRGLFPLMAADVILAV